MIFLSNKDLKCDDCGDVVTAEQMRTDQVRMHKIENNVFLCECCYEDFSERMNDNGY